MRGNLAYQEKAREELIGGEVVMMAPSPLWNHSAIAGNIYNIFFNFLRGRKCTPIQDGFDLHLDEENVFVPDFMVVCDPDKIKRTGVYGAPDLVVEVLSRSTAKNDKTRKKDTYAKCGVKEYWLVSPDEKLVEVYRTNGTELVLHNIYAQHSEWEKAQMSQEERDSLETHFKCSLFDDLDISLEDVFYRTF